MKPKVLSQNKIQCFRVVIVAIIIIYRQIKDTPCGFKFMPFCRHDLRKNFNDRKLEKSFFVSLKNVE